MFAGFWERKGARAIALTLALLLGLALPAREDVTASERRAFGLGIAGDLWIQAFTERVEQIGLSLDNCPERVDNGNDAEEALFRASAGEVGLMLHLFDGYASSFSLFLGLDGSSGADWTQSLEILRKMITAAVYASEGEKSPELAEETTQSLCAGFMGDFPDDFNAQEVDGVLGTYSVRLHPCGDEEDYLDIEVYGEVRTRQSGQWYYRLGDGFATITGCEDEACVGELTIPGEVDGYPVTHIGSSAFRECGRLSHVTIPDSVISIGDNAFFYCKGLISVTIPTGIASIGDFSFGRCARFTTVTLPQSVVDIGANPFHGSPLAAIEVSPNNPAYLDVDGVLYDKRQEVLIAYPGGREGAYVIPEVTTIGDYAFESCGGLTEVIIPDSVTSIGFAAFAWCDSLTSVTIPNSVSNIAYLAFSGCNRVTLRVQEGSHAEDYVKDQGIAYIYTE